MTAWEATMSKRLSLREGAFSLPTEAEVQAELVGIKDSVLDAGDPAGGEDDSLDVRLQVVDGTWVVHYGDPGYDTDHRGYWGASSISPADTDADLLTVAQDLISQVEDSYSESGDVADELISSGEAPFDPEGEDEDFEESTQPVESEEKIRYKDHWTLVPKRDFGGRGFRGEHGENITSGYIAMHDEKGNCLPGATWSPTLDGIKELADIYDEVGKDGFWAEYKRRHPRTEVHEGVSRVWSDNQVAEDQWSFVLACEDNEVSGDHVYERVGDALEEMAEGGDPWGSVIVSIKADDDAQEYLVRIRGDSPSNAVRLSVKVFQEVSKRIKDLADSPYYSNHKEESRKVRTRRPVREEYQRRHPRGTQGETESRKSNTRRFVREAKDEPALCPACKKAGKKLGESATVWTASVDVLVYADTPENAKVARDACLSMAQNGGVGKITAIHQEAGLAHSFVVKNIQASSSSEAERLVKTWLRSVESVSVRAVGDRLGEAKDGAVVVSRKRLLPIQNMEWGFGGEARRAGMSTREVHQVADEVGKMLVRKFPDVATPLAVQSFLDSKAGRWFADELDALLDPSRKEIPEDWISAAKEFLKQDASKTKWVRNELVDLKDGFTTEESRDRGSVVRPLTEGYTHYWSGTGQTFTDEQWTRICGAAETLVDMAEKQGIHICGGLGEGAPEINDEHIWLNGDASAEENFETFELLRNPGKFGFCKTGHRPYDSVVVGILRQVRRIAPDVLTLKSDGGPQVFEGKVLPEGRWDEPDPTTVGEGVPSRNWTPGTVYWMKSKNHGQVRWEKVEFLGFGPYEYHMEKPEIRYQTLGQIFSAYGVKSLPGLEGALRDKEDQDYALFRGMTGSEEPYVWGAYLFQGRWVLGSSADNFSLFNTTGEEGKRLDPLDKTRGRRPRKETPWPDDSPAAESRRRTNERKWKATIKGIHGIIDAMTDDVVELSAGAEEIQAILTRFIDENQARSEELDLMDLEFRMSGLEDVSDEEEFDQIMADIYDWADGVGVFFSLSDYPTESRKRATNERRTVGSKSQKLDEDWWKAGDDPERLFGGMTVLGVSGDKTITLNGDQVYLGIVHDGSGFTPVGWVYLTQGWGNAYESVAAALDDFADHEREKMSAEDWADIVKSASEFDMEPEEYWQDTWDGTAITISSTDLKACVDAALADFESPLSEIEFVEADEDIEDTAEARKVPRRPKKTEAQYVGAKAAEWVVTLQADDDQEAEDLVRWFNTRTDMNAELNLDTHTVVVYVSDNDMTDIRVHRLIMGELDDFNFKGAKTTQEGTHRSLRKVVLEASTRKEYRSAFQKLEAKFGHSTDPKNGGRGVAEGSKVGELVVYVPAKSQDLAEKKVAEAVGATKPAWEYQDARGVTHTGYVDSTKEYGGSDVEYFMRDEVTGELSVVSGRRLKDMRRLDRVVHLTSSNCPAIRAKESVGVYPKGEPVTRVVVDCEYPEEAEHALTILNTLKDGDASIKKVGLVTDVVGEAPKSVFVVLSAVSAADAQTRVSGWLSAEGLDVGNIPEESVAEDDMDGELSQGEPKPADGDMPMEDAEDVEAGPEEELPLEDGEPE